MHKLELSALKLLITFALVGCSPPKETSNPPLEGAGTQAPPPGTEGLQPGASSATSTSAPTATAPATDPTGASSATAPTEASPIPTGPAEAPSGTGAEGAGGTPEASAPTDPGTEPTGSGAATDTDDGAPPESSGGTSSISDGGSPDTDNVTPDDGVTAPTGAGDAGPVTPGCEAPTEYTNLFVTLLGKTQAESDEKVMAAWDQLYNPSNNNTVYYDGPGADESYVKDTGNNDVRTEGMSYGMMTAVQLDKQTEFDRLWTWVKNHMFQGEDKEIAWKCSTSGQKQSTGGAPDGEEYMATALIFAQKRWGDTGKFDYAAEAQWVLDLTRTKYFHQDYHIVKFVAGSGNTDGSYVLPSFYQTWACFDTANAEFWNAAVTAGREFFRNAADGNGVIPDQSSFTGDPLGGAGSDAKRCVMNIMMDHNFFGVDPWQTETYAPAFGAHMTRSSDNTAAQFSCNALLGFGLPAESGEPFVEKLWSAQIPSGQWRYYDGTLYMLGLLHVSGTFKLYY